MGDPVEIDVGGRRVRVSNPDRVVFADVGLTKLDIVEHYRALAT
ncbi:MAG: ATP-dependent DNA ligase, partial [Actinomyces sp.]